MAYQQRRREYARAFAHRPSHHESGSARSTRVKRKRQCPKVGMGDWDEVVTR